MSGPLWAPSAERLAQANITRYLEWLRRTRGHDFHVYEELWHWSVTDLEGFWRSIWDFFEVQAHQPPTDVLAERSMPGAQWFPGATLNYAEHALRRRDDDPAVVAWTEDGPGATLSHAELHRQVAAAAAGLRQLGVGRGDRVAAFMPNIPQTLVAFLATASLGAIWSSCPPDFGVRSVADRFRQIEPRVLLAVDGYRYNGRPFERLDAVDEIRGQLPSLTATVLVPNLHERPETRDSTIAWDDFLVQGSELEFTSVPFDHPLWVLYSSGTTGPPKAIVHGHGGMLLEHLKSLSLHLDLGPGDRFFWFTTTGWMMWNFLAGGLLVGATVLLYDGSPGYPDLGALWRFAEQAGATYFGTSAPFIQACMNAGLEPARDFDLTSLRSVGSTGAPLPPEGYAFVYDHVGRDLLLGSLSGGTDVCTAFVGPCPLLPVEPGEIQCRALGAKVEAFDEQGRSLLDEVGELVVTEPMPCMPVSFWDDPDGRRYHDSYFDQYPGVWRHGDWIKITPSGSCVIYGRSDSTLNRGGVRMGTAEFYRVVDDLPEVADSLVVDTGELGTEGRLLLFVELTDGAELDEELRARITQKLRRELSPRHVPDQIHAIPTVPRTLTGKKLEVPVRRILLGHPPGQVLSPGALSDPESIRYFVELARSINRPS